MFPNILLNWILASLNWSTVLLRMVMSSVNVDKAAVTRKSWKRPSSLFFFFLLFFFFQEGKSTAEYQILRNKKMIWPVLLNRATQLNAFLVKMIHKTYSFPPEFYFLSKALFLSCSVRWGLVTWPEPLIVHCVLCILGRNKKSFIKIPRKNPARCVQLSRLWSDFWLVAFWKGVLPETEGGPAFLREASEAGC